MSNPASVECVRCGAANPTVANFCRQCGAPVSPRGTRSTTPATPLLQQWRRLKLRMTRKEVRAILGEPARIEGQTSRGEGSNASTTNLERWIFEYAASQTLPVAGSGMPPKLQGIVEFAPPDGTIASWSEPDWSTL